MPATSADYQWVDDCQLWPIGAYCLTFVRALPPSEVLDRLQAQDRVSVQGARAVLDRAQEASATHGGQQLFVGVTRADGWSVMFEENGFIGVTRSIMATVSRGYLNDRAFPQRQRRRPLPLA